MPYTTTEEVFDSFKAALQALVPVETALPGYPAATEWPEVGFDRVVLFSGSPQEAVNRQLARLRHGHYGAVILVSFTTQQELDPDGGGWAMQNGLPITVIALYMHGSREQQGNIPLADEEYEEEDFRRAVRLHDAIYLELKPHKYPPEDWGILWYQCTGSFSLGGGSDWGALRLGYLVGRLADDPVFFNS